MSLNGIIIIDKPAGWTSHDVVAKLRGIMRQKYSLSNKTRVGHGGTLDPMATGVLPIFVGRATRAAEFCENAEKEYIAGLRFGIVTDTQDITGNIINVETAQCVVPALGSETALSAPASQDSGIIFADELKAVLPRFLGRQKQIPPMYSAIKKDGKKLYELARRGKEIERPARDIEITAIEIVDVPASSVIAKRAASSAVKQSTSSDIYIRVACSKGTYIRTLCHDIGAALGCGAALSYLRRTKAGVFSIDEAHPLDAVLEALANNPVRHCEAIQSGQLPLLNNILLPIDTIFSQYPSITLSKNNARRARNGAPCKLQDTADGKYRFYAPDGEFMLFGEVRTGELKTIKSFFEV